MSYARLPETSSSRYPFQYPPAEPIAAMRSFPLRATEPGRQRAPMTATRRRKLFLSYFPDWILTIALAVAFFLLDKVEGYRRLFSVTDTSLRHPYAVHERVPPLALYFIAFLAPLVIQPVINLLTIRSWWDLHNSTLGLILGLSLTGAVTQFSKITVGRPRPDVLDRCQLPQGTVDPPFGLTAWQQCTQTDIAILRDGFRSFPSGHSSLSFAGLGFLAFYIAGKLHLFDRRGHAGKAWLALAPFSAAALVAISRTMDYRHHWHDVLVGSILGTVISYFTYRQYYPSLASELSHRPYSPRIQREDAEVLPTHRPTNSAAVAQQPFLQQVGYTDPYTGNGTGAGPSYGHHSDEYELAGTVQRPNLPLEEVWKDGQNEISAPRSMTPRQQSRPGTPGRSNAAT
ncbi:putative acid phosphatase homologues [Lyophyllum shimeji]|uniref:Acid phosphatase homologues n=1 Tax=Lyophyllum shimeji TaxID=47721 RepID=A0A9P3UIF5_LYOSH|nr:putative acid phosphatase homologues [Lyophyllum shimeji]